MKCTHCQFENPEGFAFCGRCGSPLAEEEETPGLSQADLDHLRAYLSPHLISALQYDPVAPPTDLLRECVTHLGELFATTTMHFPLYLLAEVSQDPTPGQVGGHFMEGTLLFADISGFTAMSERLSRMGREGAEVITAVVNRYFNTMLAILRRHHGQLVKFGGDALLGLFPEPRSADRAAQAAQQMQAAMSRFAQTETSQGAFRLQMKISIHYGRFFAAHLGTARGMEYALFGRDVNATAAAESTAAPGQIITDPATRQAITLACQTDSAASPYLLLREIETTAVPFPIKIPNLPRLDAPTLDTVREATELLDALTPYLPAGLLARLAGDPHAAAVQGEHRLVAILFANVHGLGEVADRLGPGQEERIIDALNRYFVAMEKAVHRFGGVINKIDLYERGDKLLALFGAPLAHEDDAERAVRAALAMQETLAQLNETWAEDVAAPDLRLRQQIGVSLGYVFAGYVGTDWRHEYTVMGDEVNLAARMMGIAEPGGIVVSSDVRRKVGALFELEPRGEVKLKGKQRPAPIFAVQGRRAVPEPVRGVQGMVSPLVGRDGAWAALQTAVSHLRSGRGQVVSLVGEAGLGKSRLTAELRQRVGEGEAAPLTWIEGRCLSYTESVSYRPLQTLLRRLCGIDPDAGEAEAWNRLRDFVAGLDEAEAAASLPYLAQFLDLRLEAAWQERLRHLDPEARQRRTFLAIAALLQTYVEATGTPLVLVVDDVHWIDQASVDLLDYLLPLVNRAPLMFLLLYRPERAKACWRLHEKARRELAHRHTLVELRPLPVETSRQLLANLVGGAAWPAAVRDLILDRAEGNPLYLEEVLHTLIDDQILARDADGRWRLGRDLAALDVPDTLQGVMMARLDRLAEPPRWTAQLAAVIGRIFPFDLLAQMRDQNGNGRRLNRHMVTLQQYEIVREMERRPALLFIFKHTIMQEVCYQNLLTETRRRYHRRLARHLEEQHTLGRQEEMENLPLIAHHAFAGQDWPRALRYQLAAGREAQALFANHDAIDHLQKALHSARQLAATETEEERLAIHTALGRLFTITGAYDEAETHLETAVSLAAKKEDDDTLAHAYRWLARLHENRGDYPPALAWIEKGLAALGERETAERAELQLIAGLIYARQGDYDEALAQAEDALRIAAALGEKRALARGHNLYGLIVWRQGQNDSAIAHFQHAFTLYEEVDDINGQAISHNQIANAYFNMSQWRQADDHYRAARESFDQIGDVYNRAITDNNLGGIALNQGRLEEARDFYRAGLGALEQIGGSLWALGGFHSNLGAVYIRMGDPETARRHLEKGRDYFDQAQARDWLPELHRHLAEAARLAGERAEAQAEAETALRLARELSMRGEEGGALRLLGRLAMARGEMETAVSHLQDSVAIFDEIGDEYEWARSRLALARWRQRQGETNAAAAALADCLDVFRRLEASLDAAAARALQETLAI